MNEPFALDKLKKAIEKIESITPEYNHEIIDNFIQQGNKIEDAILMVPFEIEMTKIKTKYGNLQVVFNPYLPTKNAYIIKNAKVPMQPKWIH